MGSNPIRVASNISALEPSIAFYHAPCTGNVDSPFWESTERMYSDKLLI